MANRMVLFAHLAASAREHEYEVWNPAFDEYARFFPAADSDFLCRFPPRPAARDPRLRHAAYLFVRTLAELQRGVGRLLPVIRPPDETELDIGDPSFVRRARQRPLLVQGWGLRDYESVRRHADELRRFFRPHQRYLDEAASAVEAARRDCDVLVGVHVRRSDYRLWNEGRYFWSDDVYAQLMATTAELFSGRRVGFMVCSDEPVSLGGARGPGHPVSDLYALAGCDYLFGPPSSFSVWASFYGRVPTRLVEHPADPFSLNSFAVHDHL
jgi:hypothetical protein